MSLTSLLQTAVYCRQSRTGDGHALPSRNKQEVGGDRFVVWKSKKKSLRPGLSSHLVAWADRDHGVQGWQEGRQRPNADRGMLTEPVGPGQAGIGGSVQLSANLLVTLQQPDLPAVSPRPRAGFRVSGRTVALEAWECQGGVHWGSGSLAPGQLCSSTASQTKRHRDLGTRG